MKRFALLSIGVAVGACAINGCSTAPDDALYPCDPNAILPDPRCLKQALTEADAGTDADTDAESDADTDAAKAIDPPGLDTSTWTPPNACVTGHCVPTPVGDEAGLWEKVPLSLWIGPLAQVPKDCDDDPVYGVPNEKFRLFDQLVAPPITCSPCACGPSEGACSGVPETVELRAGKCAESGVATVPFNAPADWSGACTNADAIAAGATCPAGSQTLCTQSVYSSALPSPADDACKPSVSVASNIQTTWEIGALACNGNTEAQSCGTDTLTAYCVNDPGPAWLQCTFRAGVHEKCPENYQHARHVLYPKEPIDDRGCSACECGAPTGSACVGGLGLSTNDTCSAELVTLQVGSMGPMCYDFLAPGMAIGSKAIVNRTYLPGKCAVSGGQAVGSATADVQNAVTFCCKASNGAEIPPPK